METYLLLRFSIILFASLLLAISIVTVALAQDVNSDVSTSSRTISPDTSSAGVNGARQSAESNTLKLFAGVSHREVVPPVHEAIKPYLEKAQTAADQKVTIHDFDIPADLEEPAHAIAPYSLSDQGHMLNSSSNRVFTYLGQPVREGHLYSDFAKIGQYAPVAKLKGVDLKTSLNDYLQAHGIGDLRK